MFPRVWTSPDGQGGYDVGVGDAVVVHIYAWQDLPHGYAPPLYDAREVAQVVADALTDTTRKGART